jgi:DNA-binding YbaB/EbfC family protein
MFDGKEGFGNLLRQAQELQGRLKEVQEQVNRERVTGASGGGMVKVTATGGQEIVKVEIDASVIDPGDPELLGDLIAAACNDALRRVRELLQQRMSAATGGIDPTKLFGG